MPISPISNKQLHMVVQTRISPGKRADAIRWMEFIKADLPTFGTPTTRTRRVGSLEIASFNLYSTRSRSFAHQSKSQENMEKFITMSLESKAGCQTSMSSFKIYCPISIKFRWSTSY